MKARLKTEIWVSALIRRAQAKGAFATVLRKGDDQAGIVIIILRQKDGLCLFTPERDFSGERLWWPTELADQTDLDARVNRRVDEDPDVWIVEIDSDESPESLIGEPVSLGQSFDDDPAIAAAQALFRGK